MHWVYYFVADMKQMTPLPFFVGLPFRGLADFCIYIIHHFNGFYKQTAKFFIFPFTFCPKCCVTGQNQQLMALI